MGSIAKPAGTAVKITDNLTSTSANEALSANQGRVLKEGLDQAHAEINNKQKTITSGTGNPSGGSNGDIYIQY